MAAQISFERPFKHVFQDPNWTKKILMGGLFMLIPILGSLILMGYQKRYFKMLLEDENAQMPEVEFGKDLSAGLPILGIWIVYVVGLVIAAFILNFIPCIGQLIALVLNLVIAGGVPIAVARYYQSEQFGSAFELKQVVDFIKANLNNCGLFLGIALLAGMVGGVGVVACIIGVVFTMFWAGNVTTIALADVYRAAQQSAPVPASAPTDGAPAP